MKRPSLLLAAAVAAVLVLTIAPATGDTAFRNDPAGDVVKWVDDPDTTTPAPARAQADLVRTRVTHGPEYVRVKARFRSLSRTGQAVYLSMRFKSPRNDRVLTIVAGSVDWQGDYSLYPWIDPDTFDDGFARGSLSIPSYPCPGLTWRFDYPNDEIRVAMPRACIEKPRFFRVSITAGSSVADPDGANAVHYEDQAGGTPGGAPAFSRALYRG